METYIEPRELVDDPGFTEARRSVLAGLSVDMIDPPIADLMRDINSLPYCFSLQCCYGHFVREGQEDEHNFDRLPASGEVRVDYRIAYLCLCVENSDAGRRLVEGMKEVASADPERIQFCCARWFWERRVNTFCLQVEPDRFKHRDSVMLDLREALAMERTRDIFFEDLRAMVSRFLAE
jgi:hypothetical protein